MNCDRIFMLRIYLLIFAVNLKMTRGGEEREGGRQGERARESEKKRERERRRMEEEQVQRRRRVASVSHPNISFSDQATQFLAYVNIRCELFARPP